MENVGVQLKLRNRNLIRRLVQSTEHGGTQMKQFLLIASTMVLTLVMATTAQADVIFEPDDNFYESHRSECTYVNANYIAAGAEGETTVYQSPKKAVVVDQIPNGETMYISFGWEDWLCSNLGWIHSDDVSREYDSECFLAEHTTTLYEDDGYSAPTVQMYTYPNSGDCYEMAENADYATIGETIGQTYIDEAGLQWGYIGYYWKCSGWVCMDDPTNTALDSGVVAPEMSVSQLRGSDAAVEAPTNDLWIATGLVVAVVAVTGMILLRKKKS